MLFSAREISPVLTSIISAIAFSVILEIVFCVVDRNRDREEVKNRKDEHTVVRFPRSFFWIGCICTLFFIAVICLMSIYNNETAETWVYIGFTIFAALGVVIAAATLVWRIDLFKNEDYFLYRTSFGRTHKVFYRECLGYRFSTKTLSVVVRTEERKIEVNVRQVNFELFLSMLAIHGVKEEK